MAASLSSPAALLRAVEEHTPDVVVVHIPSPSRDALEHLMALMRTSPRPIIMFAEDAEPQAIREAVHAGVSAYVVDGFDRRRIRPIVDAAVARFEQLQRVRGQLADTTLKLDERKLIDRAKGILMKTRGLDEEDAYRALQRMAMDRNRRIGEVARNVIDMAALLR